jgi:hypothetical protein
LKRVGDNLGSTHREPNPPGGTVEE